MVQVTRTGRVFDAPRTLRIRFRKVGALQYISHLDLMRTMTRVLSRAHLPIRYTHEFNPIPYLVFSAPLPVGAQSPREYVDVSLLEDVDLDEVIAVLNGGLPDELAVDAAYFAETKLKDIGLAEYEIRIRTAGASPALAAQCGVALSDGPIVVLKHTKSGDKDVDVSPAVRRAESAYDEATGEILLCVTLNADSGSFLNPDYLIGYLSDRFGILKGSPAEEGYTVIRKRMLFADGTEFA